MSTKLRKWGWLEPRYWRFGLTNVSFNDKKLLTIYHLGFFWVLRR